MGKDPSELEKNPSQCNWLWLGDYTREHWSGKITSGAAILCRSTSVLWCLQGWCSQCRVWDWSSCTEQDFSLSEMLAFLSAGPLLELKAPAPALLSVLPLATALRRFLRRVCMGLYLVDQRLLMKLGLHAACWDIFLCMWSVAVGSADRGEWSCGLFLQAIEVTLCIFKEAPPNPRLSFPFATNPAREQCCRSHFELYPPGVKSWISSQVCWEREEALRGSGCPPVSAHTGHLWIATFVFSESSSI